MKLTVTGKIRTDIHPDDISGAVLYLVVGKYGDDNLDHAIALEGFGSAWRERDGVRRAHAGHVAFAEDFELPEAPRYSSALAVLTTAAGLQLARVAALEISQREENPV